MIYMQEVLARPGENEKAVIAQRFELPWTLSAYHRGLPQALHLTRGRNRRLVGYRIAIDLTAVNAVRLRGILAQSSESECV
jgi:hypothetical protein